MQGFLNHTPKPYRPRAADLLEEFINGLTNDTVRLGDFIDILGHRAFGVAILVFALANLLIANVPGMSVILSLPIVLISLQMLAGAHRPWLPKGLADRELKRETVEKIVKRSCTVLRKIEMFIRPRWLPLAVKNDRVLGFACLVFSIVLALPILFGNWLPSWALTLIALGMIERDGALIALGIAVGLGGLAYAIAFFEGLMRLAAWVFQ
jgi:hypothetical protein